jgi:hypothetical protein
MRRQLRIFGDDRLFDDRLFMDIDHIEPGEADASQLRARGVLLDYGD